jgi:hypothetical protein
MLTSSIGPNTSFPQPVSVFLNSCCVRFSIIALVFPYLNLLKLLFSSQLFYFCSPLPLLPCSLLPTSHRLLATKSNFSLKGFWQLSPLNWRRLTCSYTGCPESGKSLTKCRWFWCSLSLSNPQRGQVAFWFFDSIRQTIPIFSRCR